MAAVVNARNRTEFRVRRDLLVGTYNLLNANTAL